MGHLLKPVRRFLGVGSWDRFLTCVLNMLLDLTLLDYHSVIQVVVDVITVGRLLPAIEFRS